MFRILGWINVGLLVIVLLPWIGTKVNKLFFEGKNESLRTGIRWIRTVHKPAAVLLVVVAIVHGYLAVGRLILHTGTVLYVSLLLTAVTGIGFWRRKKKVIFQGHKFFALVSTLLFLLHWLAPGALRGWFQ